MDQQTYDELVATQKQVLRQFRYAGLAAILVLIAGTIIFHYEEHLRWINAVYFCVITLTTVGYGDIVPQTDLGKITDIVYILTGIGFIATFANLVIKRAGVNNQLRVAKHERRKNTSV